MLHNIIITINKYAASLTSINSEYLGMYDYIDGDYYYEGLYVKHNGYTPMYNWRINTFSHHIRNIMYTIRNKEVIALKCRLPLALR